jgi:hypothetical protein
MLKKSLNSSLHAAAGEPGTVVTMAILKKYP